MQYCHPESLLLGSHYVCLLGTVRGSDTHSSHLKIPEAEESQWEELTRGQKTASLA